MTDTRDSSVKRDNSKSPHFRSQLGHTSSEYTKQLTTMSSNAQPMTDDVISVQYNPVYEYDENAGPSFAVTGEVVCNVPREPQIDALASIMGEGAVEPDGWFEGYDTMADLPVVDGVPITILDDHSTKIGNSRREGTEHATYHAVDDSLGVVEVHHAAAHPTNASKIKVNERQTED